MSTPIVMASSPVASPLSTTYQAESALQRGFRRLRRQKSALFGGALLLGILLYIVIGSFVFSEAQSNFNDPARQLEAPSAEHPFGTDTIGRDLMIRTIYGGQISLFIAVTAVAVQITFGTVIGLIAGYFGGLIDAILMRFVEAMLSIPQLFIALLAARVFADKLPDFKIGGREFSNTLIVIIGIIGLTSWMPIARIIRGTVLSLREQDFVLAARSIGASKWRIIVHHILPNCIAPIIVTATLGVASAISLEAYLGFLGVGVRPPSATWGNMLGDAFGHLNTWFLWFFPALFVILTALGVNFLGDGLRDSFDPRRSGGK